MKPHSWNPADGPFTETGLRAKLEALGQAKPQPGDLQGASKAVANDATSVSVVIDTVVR